MTPEQKMWTAVLIQAHKDAENDRHQGRAFMCGLTPELEESCRQICRSADVDPNKLLRLSKLRYQLKTWVTPKNPSEVERF